MSNMSWKHTAWAIVFALVILAALMALPASAQDMGGATSSSLYLPAIEYHFVMWFTDAELEDAMIRDGYDPDIAGMHVNCILDVTAVPPYLYRYTECNQYYINGIGPTEDAVPAHYIQYRKWNDNQVHSVEVGQ